MFLTVIVVGSVGALYAVFGGLKAVVVSDTINGIGLLIIGILVPTLGLIMLGDGSFMAGLTTIATNQYRETECCRQRKRPGTIRYHLHWDDFGQPVLLGNQSICDSKNARRSEFSRRAEGSFTVWLF